LKLYGYDGSGNCLKAKWVNELLGRGAQWVELDIIAGASRTPEFLKVHPAGQVPVLQLDDGRVIAQSNAIILFLAEGSRLIPKDAYARAKMYEWLFWEQYSHETQIAVRRFQLAYLKKPESELAPTLLTKGNAALAMMDAHLKASPYFVGEALSLADIALVAYTRVAHEGGFDLNQYPAVKRWVARVEADLGLPAAA
jgi:glutathione S-transferase